MFTIRSLRDSDIEPICRMPQGPEELYAFFPKAQYPLVPAQFREALQLRSDSHVVDENGAILGMANFYRWGSQSGCDIGNVIVAPEARGQGVAASLVQFMTSLAYERHCASDVRISCFAFNTAALLLYPKLGFQPFAIEERVGLKGERVALVHLRHQQDDGACSEQPKRF